MRPGLHFEPRRAARERMTPVAAYNEICMDLHLSILTSRHNSRDAIVLFQQIGRFVLHQQLKRREALCMA